MAYESIYLTTFNELGLAEPILRALEAEGYTTPTPIQTQAIPVAMAGKDILGIAQTGTGKTASFVLPILHELAQNDGRPTPKATKALILAPTRELVSQIAENIRKYSKNMRVSVTVIVGGVKPGPQIRKLASGSHIIVATPGRLLDHMNNGYVNLSQTEKVVLDEADHMLDLGFIPDIRRIMKKLPKKRQTSLLSATMPPQIKALGNDFQTNPVEVAVTAASRPIERIKQTVRHTRRDSKRDLLTRILSGKEVERAIVFTRTKRGADRVSQHLVKAGLSAAAIHGNKSQGQRVRALASFKSGETSIMVATDIAARGIDISDVSHVVNFELPEVAESYVHRIGRTARAGRDGIAVSLCDPSEAKLLRDIEKLIGSKLETEGGEPYSPEALAIPDTPPQNTQARRSQKPHRKGQANASQGGNRTERKPKNNWSPYEGESEGQKRSDTRSADRGDAARLTRSKSKNGKNFGSKDGNRAPRSEEGGNPGRAPKGARSGKPAIRRGRGAGPESANAGLNRMFNKRGSSQENRAR